MPLQDIKSKIKVGIFQVSKIDTTEVIWLAGGESQIADFINLTDVKFILVDEITVVKHLRTILGKEQIEADKIHAALNTLHEVLMSKVNDPKVKPNDYELLVLARRQVNEFVSGNITTMNKEYTLYIPFENRIYGFHQQEIEFVLPDAYLKQELLKFIS